MGSDAQEQAPPAEPTAPAAAASGGSKTGMIMAIVVVAVVVIAALAYVFMAGGGDGLSGQWTATGGTYSTKVIMNNDTANTTWDNGTMPASTDIIDFDLDDPAMGDVKFEDLGDGEFRITGFEAAGADFDALEGSYDIDGDIMTVTIDNASITINDPMIGYMEIEMSMTWTLERA